MPEGDSINQVSTMNNSDPVKLEIISWLEANLARTGLTKSKLAKDIGVSKQSVTKWFSQGVISKVNLIKVAKIFNTEPPLDLVSLSPTITKNPLAYSWNSSARKVVRMLMEDQETATGRAKIEALLKMYDVLNTATK